MAKKRANGEGNIRKRADGRWEGRYTAGYHSETGKRIIKNVLGKTQAECKAKLSAAMEATRGIDVSRADEYTVATWLRSWYEIYAKPNIRISTANRYQLMVEQYTIPRIGSIKLTKLTSRDLQKLYKDLMENGRIDRKSGHGNPGLSSTTVRSLHLMLHNAFERAVKERLIPRNPTEDCIAPKIQKFEMQILQPEHIKEYRRGVSVDCRQLRTGVERAFWCSSGYASCQSAIQHFQAGVRGCARRRYHRARLQTAGFSKPGYSQHHILQRD